MKKVLYLSNFSKQRTGFARHAKTVLTGLWRAGYDVVEVACGLNRSNPILKSVPWTAYGTVPDDPNEYAYLNGQGHLLEAMFFGNLVIDEIIKKEKPDAIILVEDIWKVAWALFKPWFNKIPTLIHTPVDSSPVYPLIKDNAYIFKNIWVKSKFAERDLREVGLDAKTVPLLTDHSLFFPMPEAERKAIRNACGISEDTFVIGFVFRNQLRKLVVSLMRGFKEFQDKNPEAKAKLLLHTNFEEAGGGGWRIKEEAINLGIKKEDLLCTYICHHCKTVEVKPFEDFHIDCPRCKAPKGMKNPSIDLGVTDEELNRIYNLMDFYCHPATSGGFESPMMEASLAGLPTATCNYSFGETYCDAYTLPIDFTFYDERESGFRKSQPKEGAICEVISEVYNNRSKAKDLGAKAREWALKEFDPNVGIQKYIDFVESSENTFDYNFFDIKNVDYPPDYSIESNCDFVIDLYMGIFGFHFTKENVDVRKYTELLNNQSREEVVRQIKQVAHEHNAHQKPLSIEDFIKKTDKKKLIFVCPGVATECFSALPVVEALIFKYKDWEVYVSCQTDNFPIFEHLGIGLVPFDPSMNEPYKLEGRSSWKGWFDIAFQPYLNPSWIHNGNV